MSASRKCATNGAQRKLPIWMSSRSDGSKSHEDDPVNSNSSESSGQGGVCKMPTDTIINEAGTVSSGQMTRDFSKLLEGVILVLSGIVNPERGKLRSQALEMGAEYQPDWNSNCTLLVCAFPNTPKFRQVEAQCGTIVSKEWITECYTQKNLVDIDRYLLHPGKPWRNNGFSHAFNNDCASDEIAQRTIQKQEAQKCLQAECSAQSKVSRVQSVSSVEQKLSPLDLKKWAADDLEKTIMWLECQDSKPEPSELQKVAAGGVLTCLQDAIELLEQKQSVQQLKENWSFLPRVVGELIRMEDSALPNDIVRNQAFYFKEIYGDELSFVDDCLTPGKAKLDTGKHGISNRSRGKELVTGYDTDETVEMTEEEIDLAFESLASKKPIEMG